jgi:diadenosine tetraphosphate (Ap4A) HIT family hydrolase
MLRELSTCPFCLIEPGRILLESEYSIAFADAFPVNAGHTLVVPRNHVSTLYDLPEVEQWDLWRLVSRIRMSLLESLNPDGFNIGLNDGVAAGQIIMHSHVHVIPRFAGDVPDPRGGIRWIISHNAAYWPK